MSPIKRRSTETTSGQIFRLGAVVIGLGVILFFHVWWPIQVKRAENIYRDIQQNLSIQKSKLNNIKYKYSHMVALSSLDAWAKNNGPWITPQKTDVITIGTEKS
jgi:hypothetical protein